MLQHGRPCSQTPLANVEAPIGRIDEVDLRRALDEVAPLTCGGLSRIDDFLTLRDSFPLEDLSANELEMPLQLIVATANRLEQKLVGADVL